MTTTLTSRPRSGPERCPLGALPGRPTSAAELARWLRGVLDRPLTSYHLVLGAVALLLVVGVMMVLSASSVNAYVTTTTTPTTTSNGSCSSSASAWSGPWS